MNKNTSQSQDSMMSICRLKNTRTVIGILSLLLVIILVSPAQQSYAINVKVASIPTPWKIYGAIWLPNVTNVTKVPPFVVCVSSEASQYSDQKCQYFENIKNKEKGKTATVYTRLFELSPHSVSIHICLIALGGGLQQQSYCDDVREVGPGPTINGVRLYYPGVQSRIDYDGYKSCNENQTEVQCYGQEIHTMDDLFNATKNTSDGVLQ